MSAKNDCYRLIQEVVVARDVFCRAPGCGRLSAAGHHLYKRDRLATAFDPRYVIGLCNDHHVPWSHKEPNEFREWVISWMGEDEYYAGLRLSNTTVKHQDFEQIRECLREKLLKIKNA